jgi:hypothetical protein
MRTPKLSIALLLAVITGLLTAAPAAASSVTAIYRDCENNGQLIGHYTRAELQAALSEIPSQLAEYSNCQDLIQRALLAASGPGGSHHTTGTGAAGGGGSGGGSGGSGSGHGAKPAHHANNAAHKQQTKSVNTDPGAADLQSSSDLHPAGIGESHAGSLPAVLVVALILLAVSAVSGGAVAVRRRLGTRHST